MELEITDPTWERPSSYGRLEQLALGYLRDERDLIFIRTMVAMTLIVLPCAAALFFAPPWVVLLAAGPYLGLVFLGFAGRYGLMLHANGHRPIFKRDYAHLAHYVPWVLGPFAGHTPTSFAAHHMWMHHAENNMEGDLSSTLAYRRDSFVHFLHYWSRFFFTGHAHLVRYLVLRRRWKVLRRFAIGELSWLALIGTALWLNWAAALLVFVVPFLLMRWFLMAGNFAQHAFVDVDDPDNAYRNSNCLVNAGYNHKAYNDGYHIVHHVRPGLHWSEMPGWFKDHLDTFAKEDALVFNGINDNQHMWFLLMTGNYEAMARHLVDFHDRTQEEKVALLKGRVQRTLGELPSFFSLETEEEEASSRRMPEVQVAEALSAGA